MRTTGLVTDRRFQQHEPGLHHPERPERLQVLDKLFACGSSRDLPRIQVRPAREKEIARVHESSHLRAVAASAGRPFTRYDADTAASAGSFEAALLAAG